MNKNLPIISKINRKKGMMYKIDKEGNVLEFKYNILGDPLTLVTIAIIIIGGLYYLQMMSMRTTEANFEDSCMTYIRLREYWIQKYNDSFPTLEEVFSLKIDDTGEIIEVNNLGG